jgi:hypothetical protein
MGEFEMICHSEPFTAVTLSLREGLKRKGPVVTSVSGVKELFNAFRISPAS